MTENKVAIRCPVCGVDLLVPTAKFEMINAGTVSMIVWAHPEVIGCFHCGNQLVGVISKANLREIGLSYVAVPANGEEEKRVIIPS